ncbi:MAG: hypothetical protein JO286_07525 [Solirubrobacterales bacterium]|nr:hypothetical protein [Solirubrobacterales bacterium]MBV9807014.1 hypothetical protein [Solirubrobacterales bacterium]
MAWIPRGLAAPRSDSGDTVHEVVVKTNPGDAPNPGNPGTETVVAKIC